MELVNTLVLVGTIAVMIVSCVTSYINFRTMKLIKETKEIQEGALSREKGGLDDGKKG
ncbi:hypothetical protein [Brevibacillus choshinensis]|uniref:hypothetical protein n=1 Tax=Brevibacillus choshinensis TaxID=54911 RepID=UPI002E248BA9|nr:hypothetical protein [Brevibacillus choshinensis]